jgi:hypothetical protein
MNCLNLCLGFTIRDVNYYVGTYRYVSNLGAYLVDAQHPASAGSTTSAAARHGASGQAGPGAESQRFALRGGEGRMGLGVALEICMTLLFPRGTVSGNFQTLFLYINK